MKKILLLTLKWEHFGGYHSYVRNLYKGFNLCEKDYIATVGVCSLSGKEIKKKINDTISLFPIGIGDKEINKSIYILKEFDVIHLFHLPHQIDKNPEIAEKFYRILDFNKPLFITIHDPAEDKSEPFGMRYLQHRKNVFFFYIGDLTKEYFEKKYNFKGEVIKHPYCSINGQSNLKKENLAINTSRIDFDKFIHLILDAIPKINGKVHFYSGYKNPIYYWHYCKGKIENYWTQGFNFSDMNLIYSPAKVLIDMSKIQNDGNRTQYPILEAIDFEVVPILRKGWFKNNKEFKLEENFLEAETPQEIAEQTNRVFENEDLRVKIINNNKKLLENYRADKIAKQYLSAYELCQNINTIG